MGRHGALFIGFLFLTLAIASLVSDRSSGHSMTFLAAQTQNPCIAKNTRWSATLYNDATPTDKTWVIRVGIALTDNDYTQSMRFEFNLLDNAISAEVGRFADAGWHHIEVGPYTHYGTITAHVGGSFDLLVQMFNEDQSQAQCYSVFARAAYM